MPTDLRFLAICVLLLAALLVLLFAHWAARENKKLEDEAIEAFRSPLENATSNGDFDSLETR